MERSRKLLAVVLTALLTLTPGMIQRAWAQDDDNSASPEELAVVQKLAQQGYLADKKDFYLSAKSLTDDDVTDALVKIQGQLAAVDLKGLKPGDAVYRLEDLKALLSLVKEKSDDIVARKVSAWKFEKRVEKMIALLGPGASTDAAAPEAKPQPTPEAQAAAPQPTATATAVPGPSREEVAQLRSDLKDLAKKTADLQLVYDKRMENFQTNEDEIKKGSDENKAVNADIQEQLKLVKNLLDHVQADLGKTNDRLELVSQKASEKSVNDTELEQELTIMHKDLRDNSQDVSILKREVAKLDKSGEEKGQSPLDDLLTSKWLSGGALVVGLTALVISLTRK